MTRLAHHTLLTLALVVLFATGACSSDPKATTVSPTPLPSVTQSDSATTEPTEPVQAADIDGYMEVVDDGTFDEFRREARKASPRSPAAAYLLHLANTMEADLDAGVPVDQAADTVTSDGDAYELCFDDDSLDCVRYTNFEQDAQGRLVSFKIDGEPLARRISLGGGDVVNEKGVRVEFLTAYRTSSGTVYVSYQVTSGDGVTGVNSHNATYRAPDGRQRTASRYGGPNDLQPRSRAIFYSAFEGMKLGGVMTLEGCLDDCYDSYSIDIRTR